VRISFGGKSKFGTSVLKASKLLGTFLEIFLTFEIILSTVIN